MGCSLDSKKLPDNGSHVVFPALMLQTVRELTFRSSATPRCRLPLNVRSAGHYRTAPDWPGEDSEPKPFLQLFWSIEGSGRFRLGSRGWQAPPGTLFVYRPGEPHRIARITPRWRYRWLTLDGPEANRALERFGAPRRQWNAGRCPEEAFERLQVALKNPTPAAEREAGAIAFRILATASAPESVAAPLAERIRAALDAGHQAPDLSIDAIAREEKIHRATLFRAFKQAHGISPAEYLRHRRMQAGLRLLQETDLPVQEVAWRSGFSDPNYFARTIRRLTGRSPRELRGGGIT